MLEGFLSISLNWPAMAHRKRREAAERERLHKIAQAKAAEAAKVVAEKKRIEDERIAAEKAEKERKEKVSEHASRAGERAQSRRVGSRQKKEPQRDKRESRTRTKREERESETFRPTSHRQKVAYQKWQIASGRERAEWEKDFHIGDRELSKEKYSMIKQPEGGFIIQSKESSVRYKSDYDRRAPSGSKYSYSSKSYIPHTLHFDKDGHLVREVHQAVGVSGKARDGKSAKVYTSSEIKYTNYGKTEQSWRPDDDGDIRSYQTNYFDYNQDTQNFDWKGRDEGTWRSIRDKDRARDRDRLAEARYIRENPDAPTKDDTFYLNPVTGKYSSEKIEGARTISGVEVTRRKSYVDSLKPKQYSGYNPEQKAAWDFNKMGIGTKTTTKEGKVGYSNQGFTAAELGKRFGELKAYETAQEGKKFKQNIGKNRVAPRYRGADNLGMGGGMNQSYGSGGWFQPTDTNRQAQANMNARNERKEYQKELEADQNKIFKKQKTEQRKEMAMGMLSPKANNWDNTIGSMGPQKNINMLGQGTSVNVNKGLSGMPMGTKSIASKISDPKKKFKF